jgi:cytochrome c oxidase subunit 3
MWLFLGTEILLFAVLFASFFLYRWMYLGDYHSGSHHLDWRLGAFNTLVLLISSFTAARAVDAAQGGDNKKVVKLFAFTIACGECF